MRIQNNVTAQNSHRNYGVNIVNQSKNMEKLSSGFRVNRAADDAAGLAISEKMRTQIRGLSRASLNVQDGTSLLQVADGAMQKVHDIIQRMRELAEQSANGTNQALDREALDLEYQQLIKELDQIADTTNFNGVYPLKGFSAASGTNAKLTGTGVSSQQINIPPTAYTVPNTASTLANPPITTPVLNLPGTGVYHIDASDLAGVTNINLVNPGTTLIINGNMPNGLTFSGNGQARINGNVTGGVTVGSNNTVQVTGSISGDVYNFGKMTIGNPGTTPVAAGGGASRIYNYSDMVITNINARIFENTGNMLIGANNSSFPAPSAGNNGNLRYEAIAPATISAGSIATGNTGRVEIAGGVTLTSITPNNGTVLVEGTLGQMQNNNGLLEVAASGRASVVNFNGASARLIAMGSVQLVQNYGYAEIGRWSGDDEVDVAGSSTMTPQAIALNYGTVRNFSRNLSIDDANQGLIYNYGTISPASPGGDIVHFARGLDASGVSVDKEAGQTVTYTVNGNPVTLTGGWTQVAGGYELLFDAPDVGGNKVYFTNFSTAKKDGMQFGIQNTESIPGVNGTSGTTLAYFMEDPFIIQSGANQGDETYLSFRALNAMNLGVVEEDDESGTRFLNLGDSHIRTMEAAANSLTITLQAINDVSVYRAELGAQYNRLEYKFDNLTISTENLSAAESRIRDADMAKEMTIFTKNNILTQSSTAMLAQANTLPQGMLQLLG